MVITLRPDVEKLAREKVASGKYQDVSQVIETALKLLAQRDDVEQAMHTKLAQAESDFTAGRVSVIHSDNDFDSWFDNLFTHDSDPGG